MTVLAGRTAVVTGGARGIGRAVGAALAREGVRVVLADRDLDAAREAAAALGGGGRVVEAAALDVTDAGAFAALVADLEARAGALDVLVNNAGVLALGPFLKQDPDRDALQLAVNVGGVLAGLRAALPGMVARGGGHVVNVASVAGRAGVPNAAVYAATKHAVVGLSESVRRELEGTGVQLTWVLPGVVRTDLTAGVTHLRWPAPVTPEDVAEAVVRSLRTGEVETWVPRAGRLAHVLPAVLPRRWVERLGRWLGVDRVFTQVDPTARAAYERRLVTSPPSTSPRTPATGAPATRR